MGRLLRVTGSDLEKLTSSVLTVLTDQPKQKYPPVCQRHLPAPSAGRIRSECTALANGLGACCRPVIIFHADAAKICRSLTFGAYK